MCWTVCSSFSTLIPKLCALKIFSRTIKSSDGLDSHFPDLRLICIFIRVGWDHILDTYLNLPISVQGLVFHHPRTLVTYLNLWSLKLHTLYTYLSVNVYVCPSMGQRYEIPMESTSSWLKVYSFWSLSSCFKYSPHEMKNTFLSKAN